MVDVPGAVPPLRVLYSFPHTLGAPGIGTIAQNQVRGLVERGHDVTVYCTSAKRPVPPVRRLVETLALGQRRLPHRTLGVDRAYAYHDLRTARALRAHHHDFDIVHTWPLGALRTLTMARHLGVPGLRECPNSYTAVAYERGEREAERLGVQLPAGASHRFNSRRLNREEHEYESASAVLVPSEAVEKSFEARAGKRIRTIRHQYGFDPDRFPAPPTDLDRGSFTCAFIGSGEPRKGLHYALDAWMNTQAASTGGHFVICGTLVPSYQEAIDSKLKQPGVELRPFVHDVGSVLRQADVLVLPSVEEGSALVTYEAQASGCALLVSDASGALMTDGEEGFIHRAGDVDTLTIHLRRLMCDHALLSRMQANALAHRPQLTWATAAVRLEAIYRDLVLT
jgi:glycosyltransferase involved in cell wall biosynthesis